MLADRLIADFGVVQPEPQQSDHQSELQAEEGEAEAQARDHLERQLPSERAVFSLVMSLRKASARKKA